MNDLEHLWTQAWTTQQFMEGEALCLWYNNDEHDADAECGLHSTNCVKVGGSLLGPSSQAGSYRVQVVPTHLSLSLKCTVSSGACSSSLFLGNHSS